MVWAAMGLLQNPELVFDVDAVLRGQGADPSILRARSPGLARVAEQAIQEGRPLLQPKVYFKEIEVAAARHERLILADGGHLGGRLIVQHLAKAKKVYAILCTIGEALEKRISELMPSNMVYALALDGVGSAAVEALANSACRRFEEQVAAQGMQSTIPLSPGMVDWPVEEGQPQIFRLFESEPMDVRLTPSYLMIPRKSLSMVLGIGHEMSAMGRSCDYCTLRETCQYQDHYA